MWSLYKLQWKAFVRSAAFKTNLAIKILVGAAALFYLVLILLLGAGVYYILEDEGMEPFAMVNSILIYWWGFDLVMRYFLQKTPVMTVKPLLIQPYTRKELTSYMLGRSSFSFFNIYSAFFFIPFAVALIVNDFEWWRVVFWVIGFFGIVLFNNFLNLLVNNMNGVFIAVLLLLISMGVMHYQDIVDIGAYTQPVFQSFYNYPWVVLVPLGMAFVMHKLAYNYYVKALYLDDAVQDTKKEVEVRDYSWFNRFGWVGAFLKNDLRLILRNKRPRNVLIGGVFFLFYGFLVFNDPTYMNIKFSTVFVGLIVTGGFMLTFGGLVPSWDSAYYPLMMSQSVKYREYLASKWWLMAVATFLSIILASVYLFVGVEFYMIIVAAGIYNIGVNAHLTLLGGAYVKTPIDLESGSKPFGNKQAWNIKVILISLPKIVLPILIYGTAEFFFGFEGGLTALSGFGLLGLFTRNAIFKQIENIYKEEKHATLAAFKEKN